MRGLRQTSWFRLALVIGVIYASIGILFALPASHARAWRIAAWAVSVIMYLAHIASEHFRRRNAPPITATHVATAVAIGAFGLAVGANVHELLTGPTYRRSLAIALVAWPLLTAIPAFLVALLLTYLALLIRRTIGIVRVQSVFM